MSRVVQFVPDGVRKRVAPADVATTWQRYSSISASYALGTGDHETGFTINEVDTEPSGFVSSGIFQLSAEECHEVGLPNADLLTLEDSTAVLAKLAATRLARIMAVAHLDAPTPDCCGWLAVAHNAGLSVTLKSIAEHGPSWSAFVARNAGTDWGRKIGAYGTDCITGGAHGAVLELAAQRG